MSFIKRLFGGSDHNTINELLEEQVTYLKTLRKPAIALVKSPDSNSRIGGFPSLDENIEWPEWNGVPLSFLCQIDLTEINGDCDRNGLPASGMLYFFYDQQQETWGFDPEDRGSWRVIYSLQPAESVRAAPEGLGEDGVYREKPIAFSPILTFPDSQDERIDTLELSDSQYDQYTGICSDVFAETPAHHLFGYPSPVQGNDMDLECQLASNGLNCGDPSAYDDPKVKQLEAGRSEWILLLQLDTDDDTGMMWGDGGRLYFWVKQGDLKKANFDDCWMVLQCY